MMRVPITLQQRKAISDAIARECRALEQRLGRKTTMAERKQVVSAVLGRLRAQHNPGIVPAMVAGATGAIVGNALRTNPGMPIPGDRVRVKKAFLRSIGAYSGPIAHAKGDLIEVKVCGGLPLATVRWDMPGVADTMNVNNLEKIGRVALKDYPPQMNSHLEGSDCSACGGPLEFMGTLGNLEHYRCRNCGMQFSTPADGRNVNPLAARPNPLLMTVMGNPLTGRESVEIEQERQWYARQGKESRAKGLHHAAPYFEGHADGRRDIVEKYGTKDNPRPKCNPRTCTLASHKPKARVWKGFKGEWYWRVTDPHGATVKTPVKGKAKTERGARMIANRALRVAMKANPARFIRERVADPRGFKRGSFRTIKSGRGHRVVVGRPLGMKKTRAQAILHPMGERAKLARRTGKFTVGRGGSERRVAANPGPRRKVTMSLQKFATWVKKQRDPKLWADFVKKVKGYQKWTHGTMPKTVTVEQVKKPGMSGVWIAYDAGKSPEALYTMPAGSKRKGAWRHPWETMPSIKNDPEAGIIIQKLHGKSRITDFLHG